MRYGKETVHPGFSGIHAVDFPATQLANYSVNFQLSQYTIVMRNRISDDSEACLQCERGVYYSKF